MTATWQNAKNQETSKKLSIIQQKPLKKIRDEERTCKEEIYRRMELITVRNNTGTNSILELGKQETTSDPLESKKREQSDKKT